MWVLALTTIVIGCATNAVGARRQDAARTAIARQLERQRDATIAGDADAFARTLDSAIVIIGPDGRENRRSRAEMASDQRARWGAVVRTISLELLVDSVMMSGDTAVAFTRQRWERIIRDAQGSERTRRTEATHRESWIFRAPEGWLVAVVRVLGQRALP